MKKQVLFAWNNQAPLGGTQDIQGSFDELTEAIDYFNQHREAREWSQFTVIDRETGEIYEGANY